MSTKMIMKCLVLIMLVFASDENENVFESEVKSEDRNGAEQIVVKIEEDDYVKVNKKSNYFGVSFNQKQERWLAYRRSKNEKKNVYNGTYNNEETAAHASDTLARKLIANREKGHKLNFPDDDTEVHGEERSNYVGVSYSKKKDKWAAQRWSKNENKHYFNGTSYKNEVRAAHASDTLARELIANGEKGHKLNFPDDDTEVYAEKRSSVYIGVSYNKRQERWGAGRWSKNEDKVVHNGTAYKGEVRAAHASDTLARKLIANGEKGHKLNFPDDNTEVHPEEKSSDYIGVYHKRQTKWCVYRRSNMENRLFCHGSYNDEEAAAHASDTLARKLIANGEKGHRLNFSEDDTEVYPEKKSSDYIGVSYHKKQERWCAQRHSKNEGRLVHNESTYKNEETAVLSSDTLARKLIANGEKGHKLNSSDDDSKVHAEELKYQKKKRKRQNNLGHFQDKKSHQNSI